MAPTPKPKPKKTNMAMPTREAAARMKTVKAASKMTPREAAARKIGSESLARRQSENTTGMWSNDKPRGQKVPTAPKYKDPTKIKGFAYGKKTQ